MHKANEPFLKSSDQMKENVLIIASNSLGHGGVQAVIMSIVRSLKDIFCFDIVVFSSSPSFYDLEFLSYGGEIIRCPVYEGKNPIFRKFDIFSRAIRFFKFSQKLLIDRKSYSAIHCHNHIEAGPFLKAAVSAGITRRIVHTHVITGKAGWLRTLLYNKYRNQIAACATHRLGCSSEACASLYGRSSDCQVINNAFQEAHFDLHRFPLQQNFPLYIIQIGNFSDLKNQLFTLKVISNIKQHYPQVKCGLVGSDTGGYEKRIRSEITMLGLGDEVELFPHDTDIPALLSQSAALIHPSRVEGFGIVLVEAQAMGVHCYVSDSVPFASDCGGCTYFSLNAGAEAWAMNILADYHVLKGAHHKYDVDRFRVCHIVKAYNQIYSPTPDKPMPNILCQPICKEIGNLSK